jgi:HAD superfamily hydrolase (TIGR01549 family)
MTLDYGRRIESTGDRALLYPGVHEALGALRARGACLLLLTNGFRDYQLPMARALGLDGYFQAILASDDLGTVKPRPEAFERAFSACPAGRSARRFHVGDTLSHDVAGARACGIFAVWIEWELPEDLGRLGPLERAGAPALQPLLRARLERELGREGPSGQARLELASVQPDAVIRSLTEMEAVVEAHQDCAAPKP